MANAAHGQHDGEGDALSSSPHNLRRFACIRSASARNIVPRAPAPRLYWAELPPPGFLELLSHSTPSSDGLRQLPNMPRQCNSSSRSTAANDRVAALSDEEASGSSGEEQVPAQKPTKGSKAKAEPIELDDDEEEDEYAHECFRTSHVLTDTAKDMSSKRSLGTRSQE